MKRGNLVFVCLALVLILSLSVVSASWFGDLWGKITGTPTGSVVSDTGLVAYYPLDGNANDASGNGNTGTVTGATLVTGKEGQAYNFDGVNDYITLSNEANFDIGGDLTMAMWIKLNSVNKYSYIITKMNEATSGAINHPFQFFIGGDNKLAFYSGDGGGYVRGIYDAQTLNKDIWYHVAVVYKKSTGEVVIYLDGVGELDPNGPMNDRVNTNYQVKIGYGKFNNQWYYPFNGAIDDVRIYSRVLTASEIQELYNPIVEPVATCTDGIKNQDETGIDCGGVCPACVVAPTCGDGIKNQDETGIDCGGVCPACVVAPTCTDGIKNQDETGIDCGGVCPTCSVPICTPSWICSAWSACVGGTQTKTCTDANSCGVLTGKPVESQACDVACTPNCPSANIVACGQVITDPACAGCNGKGTLCQTGTCDLTQNTCVVSGTACSGCDYNSLCLPTGYRADAKYCDITKSMINQKETGTEISNACENNYECKTNICSNGYCVDLKAKIEENASLLGRIWCKITNLFSEQDYLCCLDNTQEGCEGGE